MEVIGDNDQEIYWNNEEGGLIYSGLMILKGEGGGKYKHLLSTLLKKYCYKKKERDRDSS